jgi:membrane fusion protein
VGIRQEIATLDQQLADQRRLLALAEQELGRVREVASKGFISRRDVEHREATMLARRQQLAQLQQSKAAKFAGLAEVQRAATQAYASAQARAVTIQAEKTALAQQSAQFDAAKGYALTSPIDGNVTALTARLGQPAAEGQPLMVIVPAGGRVRVELNVPSSSVGFLAKGQHVRVAVDAFPYQQYGVIPARITEVAGAASNPLLMGPLSRFT